MVPGVSGKNDFQNTWLIVPKQTDSLSHRLPQSESCYAESTPAFTESQVQCPSVLQMMDDWCFFSFQMLDKTSNRALWEIMCIWVQKLGIEGQWGFFSEPKLQNSSTHSDQTSELRCQNLLLSFLTQWSSAWSPDLNGTITHKYAVTSEFTTMSTILTGFWVNLPPGCILLTCLSNSDKFPEFKQAEWLFTIFTVINGDTTIQTNHFLLA